MSQKFTLSGLFVVIEMLRNVKAVNTFVVNRGGKI